MTGTEDIILEDMGLGGSTIKKMEMAQSANHGLRTKVISIYIRNPGY